MQAFITAFRAACLPGPWSQGSKMAREGAVRLERAGDDELVLRVQLPGLATIPTVHLYLSSDEWACNCDSLVDPCAHAAAAVAALQTARQRGEDLPRFARAEGRLSHRFARGRAPLRPGDLARVVVHPDGREEALTGALTGAIAGDEPGATYAPTDADLRVDRVLDVWAHGGDDVRCLGDLLTALSDCPDVRVEGRAVRASGEPVLPRAVVDDQGSAAFVLRLERDPAVTDVVAPGLALCGETLRPVGERALGGAALEKLPLTRVFPRERVAELVLSALPALAGRATVEVRTTRLPAVVRGVAPRVVVQLAHAERALTVVPRIVYGAPPCTQVEGGALRYLQGPVPARDEAAERALVARLRDELNLVPERAARFEGHDAVRFASQLQRWGAGSSGDGLLAARELSPRVDLRDGGFDVVFEAPGDDAAAPGASPATARAEDVLAAWREGLGLVGLSGGGFAPLPTDWLARFGPRVAELLAARAEDGTVARAALPALARLCDDLEHPRPADFSGLEPLLGDFDAIPDAALPADLTATLRPYQRRGVAWLCFLRDAGMGAVLADDMGLGKTLQALCALRGRTLVVCPRSVVHNWADEVKRFRPGLRCALYHGPRRALDPAADVTLTTYAVLRLDADALAATRWDAVVLDEAQNIKNPDSQAARAAFGLRAGFRVALSGTPVENRLEELWSLSHFANPGLLGGRGAFRERYGAAGAELDARAMRALRATIGPFVLRRLKRDVAPELPPRTDLVLYCELDEAERAVYEAVRAATRQDVVEGLRAGGGVLEALEALLRLRQAACHPALVPGQRAASSSKVERLVEALESAAADGHKALVFSQWTGLLDLVEPHLRAADVPFARLDGATRDRGAVIADFQRDEGPPVLLVSLKAGGTGLNLTAADHVFLLDPWWNPAAEDQAADRAHRIGQTRPVLVYRLVARDTVEEGILALQQRKRGIADAVLAGAERGEAVTRDDLLALLA